MKTFQYDVYLLLDHRIKGRRTLRPGQYFSIFIMSDGRAPRGTEKALNDRICIENPWKEKCLVNYDDGTRVKKGRDGIEYIFQETGPLSFDNGKLLAVFSTYRMLFE